MPTRPGGREVCPVTKDEMTHAASGQLNFLKVRAKQPQYIWIKFPQESVEAIEKRINDSEYMRLACFTGELSIADNNLLARGHGLEDKEMKTRGMDSFGRAFISFGIHGHGGKDQ